MSKILKSIVDSVGHYTTWFQPGGDTCISFTPLDQNQRFLLSKFVSPIPHLTTNGKICDSSGGRVRPVFTRDHWSPYVGNAGSALGSFEREAWDRLASGR